MHLYIGGYAVVATSDHASDGLTESAFPLHGSDDLVNWQPQVRSLFVTLRGDSSGVWNFQGSHQGSGLVNEGLGGGITSLLSGI